MQCMQLQNYKKLLVLYLADFQFVSEYIQGVAINKDRIHHGKIIISEKYYTSGMIK